MDPQTVWTVWRRILKSDDLVDAVMQRQLASPAVLALAPAEQAVVADYASDPAAADITIGMYRRGLVRNAISALKLAPLSRHVLYAGGEDIPAVMAGFAKAGNYKDYGPCFWEAAADLTLYFQDLPLFADPSRQDALRIDQAGIALARDLAAAPPLEYPDHAAVRATAFQSSVPWPLVASRAARVVSVAHDMTPWLEEPHHFDISQKLKPAAQHWLVFMPDAESALDFAELSERAAWIFQQLSSPKTLEDLASARPDTSVEDIKDILTSLCAFGVVNEARTGANGTDAQAKARRGEEARAGELASTGGPTRAD